MAATAPASLSAAAVESFWSRWTRLHGALCAGELGADALSIALDPATDEDEANFNKASALMLHLFGLELAGSLLLACEGGLHVVATAKKLATLATIQAAKPDGAPDVTFHKAGKEDELEANCAALVAAAKASRGGSTLGVLAKMKLRGALGKAWTAAALEAGLESVDASNALGLALAVKDEAAVVNVRKASTITQKVLKNGIVRMIEDVFDQESTVTHEELATKTEEICEDPSKIKLKVPAGVVESCYFPIVQSGGEYDIRPSAATNSEKLADDVVIVALGARYRSYCANVARTLFVDPVPSVEQTYAAVLEMRRACLNTMRAGRPLKDVAEACAQLVKDKHPHLLERLPKNFGFAIGLDYREAALVLTSKNAKAFASGMVFNLAVGLADVPLESAETEKALGSIKKLTKYSILVADTILIGAEGDAPEVLTKHSLDWGDVSYFINETNDEADDDDDDDDDDAAQPSNALDHLAGRGAVLSSRLRERGENTEETTSVAARGEKQAELMRQKLIARRKVVADKDDGEGDVENVREIEAYRSSKEYPSDLPLNEVHVDFERQVVFVPINGSPVPFHISMIKNVVQPDADRSAAYLRLNFYTPGQSLGKDVPQCTAQMIEKHGREQVFVKEMLYRSREQRKLTAAYRAIQELRKRFRQSAAKAAEEADLVVQEKLVKTRDGRVPRMADLTMRPFLSGKKTLGTLEAHANGLRFTSKKHEVMDIMYGNIKHALYQPCENEVMVLVHFHLKNPIMIGKKKSKDVQFYADVMDASVALDSARRSMYDPDELDEEQRERNLRKKLNELFKDFCKKVERVAKLGDSDLEFDIPYRDLGFHGVPVREMVLIQPTVHCLVNLTETPFFIIELENVEHVHFERCTLRSSNFDMVVIFKNLEQLPASINAVPMAELDAIQEWLTDCSLTYTAGQASMSWKSVMGLVRADDRFYEATDEFGEPKPAGWHFLQADEGGDDDDDEEEGDGDYEEDADADEESSSEEEESEEDAADDDSDDSDDDDDDDEAEEEGMDWDDMEKEAKQEDERAKRERRGEEEPARPAKKRKG